MSRASKTLACCAFLFMFLSTSLAFAQSGGALPLNAQTLELQSARMEVVSYRGREAVHLQPPAGQEMTDVSVLAIVKGTDFKDGMIEIDVAGAPRAGADPSSKGFVGVAFRVQPKNGGMELIYLRPVNGRADDQLTRNHSAQYVSDPDYGWKRLRTETPGKYESYVDLEAGAWTRMKIEVSGTKARLYINGASQPCLIVNDLKRGDSHGAIALWSHPSTEAYFANLTVK